MNAKIYLNWYPVDDLCWLKLIQSSAESLPFLEDGDMDLSYRVSIVMHDFVSVCFTEVCSGYVAQAAHWFDFQKYRQRRPRFFVKVAAHTSQIYFDFQRHPTHPSSSHITAYVKGDDPTSSLGRQWQHPVGLYSMTIYYMYLMQETLFLESS